MTTILFPSPVFGPVHSRRLGVSLGVNLLPADGKLCSFDCIYCECGLNAERRPHSKMPSRETVREALKEKLASMHAEGVPPDTITFAGNGEPTGHPDFEAIVEDTIALRNRWCPRAEISVLTNATHLEREGVRRALMKVDNPLLKLDTVDIDYIRFVDRPNVKYDVETQIEHMREFGKRCLIQSMFLTGEHEGRSVDNTTENFVEPWLEAVKHIGPRCVTIYTIDRETSGKGLKKASSEVLDAIAKRVRELGIETSVSY